MSESAVLSCENLSKSYTEGPAPVAVLNGIDLQVNAGELIAIVGSSGSGKTTLLNLLGGLDSASAGSVQVDGVSLSTLSEQDIADFRNKHLGFVYQFHHLLREFSALENVAMPLLIRGTPVSEAHRKAANYLERVGLGHRLEHRPPELSGGERQRVAIARALVGEPRCVLMDEPTGNLDRPTALEIQGLIRELNQALNISFVIVTHDEAFAATLQRRLALRDGGLSESGISENSTSPETPEG